MKYLRASLRALIALPMAVAYIVLAAAQAFVVGPVLRNRTAIPNLLYNGLGLLLGYHVKFNAASAPLAKGKPVWFIANHFSNADFVVLGAKLKGTFAGKGEVLKWPLVAPLAKALKYIGLRRSREFNAESRGMIVQNFNTGANTIMFPEGTTGDGKKVHLFHQALFTFLYGESAVDKKQNEVKLEKEIVIQPVAIKLLEINGKDATNDDHLRDLYSMQNENNFLTRVWKRMLIRSTTVEIQVFPALDPKEFKNAIDLVNHAATDIASVINPGQTTFEKAVIPGKVAKPAV